MRRTSNEANDTRSRLKTALQAVACVTVFGLLAAVAAAGATAQDVDSMQDASILADPPRVFTSAADVSSTNRASPDAESDAVESGTVEAVDERLCGVSDDSSLKAAAVETTDGHWSHEDWLAKGSSQDAVFRIHEALGDLPALAGSGAASTPETETLASRAANGVVGVTADNVTQRLVVVVDSSVVSLEAVGEALREIDSELRIEVRPSCRSIAQLAATEDTLKARQWHPSASEASYGYYMDPATASFKVTFASGSVDVAQSLKDLLGDTVEITYGEPSRRGRPDEHSEDEDVVPG